MWEKDPTLWSQAPAPELEDRLGWLDLPTTMQEQIAAIDEFRKQIRKDGTSHVVLLGMGGSSLAPEVFGRTFRNGKRHPQLIVLDSTHPDAVRAVERQIDLERTLFIVSSKSGTTTETLSFFKYFWQRVKGMGGGKQFVAITDPGTPLETLAGERGFRTVFSAPPDVGGRYSALSVFGLVPAALIGVDVHKILDGAWAMTEDTSARAENPALELGAALGELALAGRDKLTIVTSTSLDALPAWIEQLVAESTGKNETGIVPVVDEPPGEPASYGADRCFVHISTRKQETEMGEWLSSVELGGHPVIRIQIANSNLLGQEFFRWEVAIAAASSVLGIHPFNQPDVQLAKELARRKMDERQGETSWEDGTKTIDADRPAEAAKALETWLAGANEGDYVAIQAYLAPDATVTAALQEFRSALRDRLRLATTLGYGPRFLHSTGQLHKGGPNSGLFVQIVDDPGEPVDVPETGYSFRDLIRAQAMGDAGALAERGRRVIRIRIGAGGVASLGALVEAMTQSQY